MDIIQKLKTVKDIMHDAEISGIENVNHFQGAKEYIDEVIDEINEEKETHHANRHRKRPC